MPQHRCEKHIVRSDGCWEWTGRKDRDGYGLYGNRRAHRVVYEALVGPIPEGMTLDHLCFNRSCVKPEHLEPVTQAENYRRVVRKREKEEPECPECGTPWSRTKRGTRICKPCVAAKRAEARFYGME